MTTMMTNDDDDCNIDDDDDDCNIDDDDDDDVDDNSQ